MVEKHSTPHEHGKGSETLLGSSVLKSTYKMKDGGILQLGTIVNLAWKLSKLTAEAWNALPEDQREERLQEALKHYSNEIAEGEL